MANQATHFEDRPWPENSIQVMDEKGGTPDLIQILCYLDEADTVAPTKVVYRVVTGSCIGMAFCDEVKRLQEYGWIKEPMFTTAITF